MQFKEITDHILQIKELEDYNTIDNDDTSNNH